MRKRNLCGQMAHHLGIMILNGEIKPGEAIPPEEKLMAEMGVSRTVLREAIKLLEAKRLLASKPKIGTRVLDPEHWNFLDLDVLNWWVETDLDHTYLIHMVELRRAMEPQAARILAEHAGPEDLEALDEAIEKMRQSITSFEAWMEAEVFFHTLILRLPRNPLFNSMANVVQYLLKASLKVTNPCPDDNPASVPLHEDVVRAIHEHEPSRAEEAMLTLFADAITRIKRKS